MRLYLSLPCHTRQGRAITNMLPDRPWEARDTQEVARVMRLRDLHNRPSKIRNAIILILLVHRDILSKVCRDGLNSV